MKNDIATQIDKWELLKVRPNSVEERLDEIEDKLNDILRAVENLK